jgi:gamma-glutamyltranspeptidase
MSDSAARAPYAACRAPEAMVSTVDNLACAAGIRMLHAGGTAVDAALAANAVLSVTLPNRWALRGPGTDSGFSTRDQRGEVRVLVEGQAPPSWAGELARRGHAVEVTAPFSHDFGHAQVIARRAGGLEGAADPRSLAGAALGLYHSPFRWAAPGRPRESRRRTGPPQLDKSRSSGPPPTAGRGRGPWS